MTPPAPAEPADPWLLVRAVQHGDAAAFAGIYRRYARVIQDYAYARTGNHAVAEDVASETFLRAFRSIRSVHEHGKDLGSWLITIARNIVVDIAKSSWNRYAVITPEPPERIGPYDAPEQEVLDAFDHAAVLLGLGELTPAQRECLWLRFFANLSVDEVGKRMGRNRTSVRALQYRAVRRLAEVLPPWVHSADGESPA